MNLTNHFTLEEMLRSDTATRLDIYEQFTPNEEITNNLTALCKNVLEPLCEKLASSSQVMRLRISSGYRCARLNRVIGGASNSQHTKGQAADTEVVGMDTQEWYVFVKNSGVVFDQLIQEFGKWALISYNPNGVNRQQCLRAIRQNGKTIYLPETN